MEQSGRRGAFPQSVYTLFWGVATTLYALGCSGGEGAGGDSEKSSPVAALPTLRDSAGITIVENAEPQWAPGSEWQVGRLLTSIGEAQGDPAHELFRVLDATRQSDGTVVVGNSSNGEIRFFDPDGNFLRKVGSTGGGPGEFRGANALRALRRVAGDTLVTWDIYGQSISVWAPDGGFVRSFSLEGPAQQHFFAGSFGDRSLLLFVFEYPPREPGESIQEGLVRTNMSLHRYGVDHRLDSSIREIPRSDNFQARWGDYGMMSTEPPFGRTTSISTGGARTYVTTGDADEVSVYDQSGELEMLIRRTLEPRPVTQEMIERDKARRLEEETSDLEESHVEPRVMRMIADLPYPEFLPPYGRGLVDSELNLWLEDFRVQKEEPATWSVFDPEGRWLGRVTLPNGLRVFEIGPDYILARTLNDMDVEIIQVHELIKG